jgi:molybdopterin-guanine dinucleotide biosynthesis protein A
MLAHVVSVLREVVDEVVVVSSAELDPPPVPALVVRDPEPDLGPLAGIAQGLAHVGAELAYVTGTDVPFLTPAFARTLLSFGGAAAPEVGGFVQTLAAAYPRAARDVALSLLEGGRRRPLALLEALGYRKVREHELPDLDSVRGFNTPEAYLEAVAREDRSATAALEFVGRPRQLAGCDALEVPVGRLADVLARAPARLALCSGERVAPRFLVSLDGRDLVRDARVPIGPGERVIVSDAAAGG